MTLGDRQGLVWLTSYPRSGNTWVRQFLHSYVTGKQGESRGDATWLVPAMRKLRRVIGDEGIRAGNLAPFERKAFRKIDWPGDWSPRLFVKTHDRYGRKLPLRDATAGAILIVRNPRDILLSAINYWAQKGTPVDDPVRYAKGFIRRGGDAHWKKRMARWEEHGETWMIQEDFPVHLLRFEDLKLDPESEFRGLIRFLGFPLEEDRFRTALESTSLSALRALEVRDRERSGEDVSGRTAFFFNEGKSGRRLDEELGCPGLDDLFDRKFGPRCRRLERIIEERGLRRG